MLTCANTLTHLALVGDAGVDYETVIGVSCGPAIGTGTREVALGCVVTLVLSAGVSAARVEHVTRGPVVAQVAHAREAILPRVTAVTVNAPQGAASCNKVGCIIVKN